MLVEGWIEVFIGDTLVSRSRNTFTDAGYVALASAMASGTVFHPQYIGLGSALTPTAPSRSDTALNSPVGTRELAATIDQNRLLKVSVTFPVNNPVTQENISEAGLYLQSSGGPMVARALVTPAQVKPTDDTMKIFWNISLGGA